MLKILQARIQQYVNHELPDVQASLGKAEEPEIKLPIYTETSKKQENSRKTSTSALLNMLQHLTLWITKPLEKSERDGNTRPPELPPEKSACNSRCVS